MENQQGISYGANEIRDGVSLNAQRKMRRVVTPTQIMQLDNLEGYLKVVGKYPTGHFTMTRQEMKKRAPSFIRSPTPDTDIERVPAAIYREMATPGGAQVAADPGTASPRVETAEAPMAGTLVETASPFSTQPTNVEAQPAESPAPTVATDMLRPTDKLRMRAASASASKTAVARAKPGGDTQTPVEAQSTLNFESASGSGGANA